LGKDNRGRGGGAPRGKDIFNIKWGEVIVRVLCLKKVSSGSKKNYTAKNIDQKDGVLKDKLRGNRGGSMDPSIYPSSMDLKN